MVKIIKKALILALTLAVAVCLATASFAETVNVAYEAAATENYYLTADAVTDGTSLSEYLALVYSGFTVVGDSYLQGKDGVTLLATEIITNAAEGRNADTNKTSELASMQKEDGSFGSFDETCLAMIALKTTGTVFSSEKAVNFILSNMNEDGLFAVTEDLKTNIEATALALTVLTPYTGAETVFDAVKKAAEYLHTIQNEDGSFADGSSVTLSKVITALSDIGESPNSDIWKKLAELLLKYKNEDGSYKTYLTDEAPSPEATAEALCALHSLSSGASPLKKLMNDGKLSSYELTDILPFAILYAVVLVGSIIFWIYIMKKKQNTRTLDEAKKAYELC